MEFAERFKNYTNAQLLYIIEHSNEYQTEAVDTAKTILSNRQISEEEINKIKVEIVTEKTIAK